MINLYTPEGWIDVPSLEEGALTFNVGYGARGIGKTFGFLADCRLDHPRRFLLLRRSQVQADLIASSEFSPFRALDRVRGSMTCTKRINRYLTGVYQGVQLDDGRLVGKGTHSELMERCPVYKEIYDSQFGGGEVRTA